MSIPESKEWITSNVVQSERGDDEDEAGLVLCGFITDIGCRKIDGGGENVTLSIDNVPLTFMNLCNVGLDIIVVITVLRKGIVVVVVVVVVLQVFKNGLVRELWQGVVCTKGQCPDGAQYHRCVAGIVLVCALGVVMTLLVREKAKTGDPKRAGETAVTFKGDQSHIPEPPFQQNRIALPDLSSSRSAFFPTPTTDFAHKNKEPEHRNRDCLYSHTPVWQSLDQ